MSPVGLACDLEPSSLGDLISTDAQAPFSDSMGLE